MSGAADIAAGASGAEAAADIAAADAFVTDAATDRLAPSQAREATGGFATIDVADSDAARVVTLSRPERRNALDEQMVGELHGVCAALEARPRILVLTGAGTAFSAGADLREMRERTAGDALRGINSGLFERVAALPLPTIAALNGPALGGGAELAYACDFRVAASAARVGNPEVALGIMPAAGACWRLRELVGLALAREMLLAGRTLDAEQAASTGLVNEIVAADQELLDAALALARRIGKGAPLALRLTKLSLSAPPAAHPRLDDIAQAVLFETPEKRERMTRFLEHARRG